MTDPTTLEEFIAAHGQVVEWEIEELSNEHGGMTVSYTLADGASIRFVQVPDDDDPADLEEKQK